MDEGAGVHSVVEGGCPARLCPRLRPARDHTRGPVRASSNATAALIWSRLHANVENIIEYIVPSALGLLYTLSLRHNAIFAHPPDLDAHTLKRGDNPLYGYIQSEGHHDAAFTARDCAACAAFTPIQVFSTKPSNRCMSELQSFITSSALLLLRKLTMPAGRSIRAHTVPETTSLHSVSSVCCWVRSRSETSRVSVIRV